MPGDQRDRPADVLLDTLRGAGRPGQPVRALLEICGVFGFSPNTVRVTLTRLVARGLVESPGRGQYRLSRRSDALATFVERWRRGEDRVRPWTRGLWLVAHDVQGGRWATEAIGFREVRPGLHARPDNLAMGLGELRGVLTTIGLPDSVPLLAGEFDGDAGAWRAHWDVEALEASYRDMLERLQASAARLEELPRDAARHEAFQLGGLAIRTLAKDPLLPEQWLDTAPRRALWQAMLDYDVLGRRIWAFQGDEPQHLPFPSSAVARR